MINRTLLNTVRSCSAVAVAVTLAACASPAQNAPKPDAATPVVAAAAARPAVISASLATIRVKAGLDEGLKDSKGTMWSADSGYDGGESVDRPELQITGTDRPELYHAERYSMDDYSFKVPNGDYIVKLHFSEDYDGLSDPSQREFTYAVKDGDASSGKTVKEVKNFSPWRASGAQFKAYVDTVPITVTQGRVTIKFTPQEENPQINAIEIVPK